MPILKQRLIGLPGVVKIEDFPLFPDDINRLIGIKVYNCGQGDAIGVFAETTSKENVCICHIDYGGYQENPQKEHKYKDCLIRWPISDDGAIILSHWDQDHFWTGKSDVDLHDRKWLVPRQKVSTRASVFSAKLKDAKCWPGFKINRAVRFQTILGDEIWIEKLGRFPATGASEDRNRTGLAVSLVRKNDTGFPDLIICPGDAPYDSISHLQYLRPKCILVGLVAYHHGSHVHWTNSQERLLTAGKTADEVKVVYSCSQGNSYGHPTESNYQDTFANLSDPTKLLDVKTYQSGNPYEEILFP